jgi:DNA topoisomerase-1
VEVLRDFYGPFEKALVDARETAQDAAITVPKPEVKRTGETCPECGGDVVIRSGKFGKFKGCANYPTCKWTVSLDKQRRPKGSGEPTGASCPECGGDVVVRKGKYGPFRACSNFPTCRWSAPLQDESRPLQVDEAES